MTSKGQRKANGHDLSESPAHLMRRCHQFYGDLFARESGAHDLTKQQYLVLLALEHNETKGISQTALVEMTGIDRSTLAEMVRRMLERNLIGRERVKDDQRANAVTITPGGRKALRGARLAAGRAEKALLEVLPAAERARFVKSLATIAAAAEMFSANGAPHPVRRARPKRRNVD
jgi:DNA-binding MarR family transcriptional regulator